MRFMIYGYIYATFGISIRLLFSFSKIVISMPFVVEILPSPRYEVKYFSSLGVIYFPDWVLINGDRSLHI